MPLRACSADKELRNRKFNYIKLLTGSASREGNFSKLTKLLTKYLCNIKISINYKEVMFISVYMKFKHIKEIFSLH